MVLYSVSHGMNTTASSPPLTVSSFYDHESQMSENKEEENEILAGTIRWLLITDHLFPRLFPQSTA